MSKETVLLIDAYNVFTRHFCANPTMDRHGEPIGGVVGFLNGLLLVEDKLSMAHSVETRLPFLDNDLVDFAQKIPLKLKLNGINNLLNLDENEIGKFKKSNNGKIILRKSMNKYLPKKIYGAVKQGFSSPDNSWFKNESLNFIKNNLFTDNSNIYQYMDKEIAKKLVREHLHGKINRRLFIYTIFLYF